MQKISCILHMAEYKSIIPEEYELFCKLVNDLLKDNEWMLLEEAQRYAYQQVRFMRIEELD